MGCRCNERKDSPQQTFLVTLPDGKQQTVFSVEEAKILITMNGGGSYRQTS